MSHQERNIVEILRRLDDTERKLKSSQTSKTSVQTFVTPATALDHRLLAHLNTESHMHLTGNEYRSLLTVPADHGLLAGLRDNDHPQYIRHATSEHEWDMLAASQMDSSNNIMVFVRKGIDDVRNKISEKLFPEFDSPNAMAFYKSDGLTPVVIVDTLNKRVGIGGVHPQSPLDVRDKIRITKGHLEFFTDKTAQIYSNTGIKIHGNASVTLSSQTGDVVILGSTNMRSETFAQDVYGWSIRSSGDAYFRNVKVNKINARIISTGTEQYVGGRQTMCKSASPLAKAFTVPSPGESAELDVEPFADYPLVNVFEDGDIVRLAHISLYDGKYNTSECWGTVVLIATAYEGAQSYTFTRSARPNSGSCGVGFVIPPGELVLNFGTSGSGYIVSTVV